MESGAPAARQARWLGGARDWFGWLHARAEGSAWAATCGADGPLIGYARAIRDPRQRVEQLTELFVHPALHGGGIGRALLGSVLSRAVPPGWRRIIVANPTPAAEMLYVQWGTFPLATAWYLRLPTGAGLPPETPEIPEQILQGDHGADAGDDLDRAVLGMARPALHAFLAAHPAASRVTLARDGVAEASGWRWGGEIGPVVARTPAAMLALVRAHILAATLAGTPAVGMWIPGANTTLLRWLVAAGYPMLHASQVIIMASDPALTANLDRCLLPAPPYVW